MNRIMRFYNSK